MRNFRIFLLFAVILTASIFIYSCTRDKADETVKLANQTGQTEARVQITTPIDKDRLLDLRDGKGNSIRELELRNTSSTTSTCFPTSGQGGNTNCTQLFGVTAIGSLPSQFNPAPIGTRPACNDFQITYDVLECYDINTGQWSFFFSNFNAEVGNCPAFQTWFNNLSPAEQGNQIDRWEYQLSFPTQQSHIQNTILNTGLPYTPCPEPTFNSNWATELCSYRCRVPMPSKEGLWKFVIRRTICGGQCCIRSVKGCINQSGFYITFGTPTFETVGPGCPITTPVCPPNSILLDPKCGKVCGPK